MRMRRAKVARLNPIPTQLHMKSMASQPFIGAS